MVKTILKIAHVKRQFKNEIINELFLLLICLDNKKQHFEIKCQDIMLIVLSSTS